MATQRDPSVEIILPVMSALPTPSTKADQRRVRRHLDRTGRADWAISVGYEAAGLDAKGLRERFADRTAEVVAFLRLDGEADLETLLAPLADHRRVGKQIFDRRTALKTAGGGLAAAVLLAACGGSKNAVQSAGATSTSGTGSSTTGASTTGASTTGASTTGASTSAAAPSAAAAPTTLAPTSVVPVALAAETTEGPYYLNLNLVRKDIREDRQGAQFDLDLVVVDESGKPIPNAAVDIWHCDAAGAYSGFVSQSAGGPGGGGSPGGGGPGGGGAFADAGNRTVQTGRAGDPSTFLRGTQMSDANGRVSFTTIYPVGTRAATSTSTCWSTSAPKPCMSASCSSTIRSATRFLPQHRTQVTLANGRPTVPTASSPALVAPVSSQSKQAARTMRQRRPWLSNGSN